MSLLNIGSKIELPPPLENGDRLDQKTFHERYEAMPRGTRAELIGGIVYMPPLTGEEHSGHHSYLVTWLTLYQAATAGTWVSVTPTIILGDQSEPEPDAVLRIAGGSSRTVKRRMVNFIAGPPELVAEVSASTESIDLNQKRLDYESNGVSEYIVLMVRAGKVVWFARKARKFVEVAPNSAGIICSKIFPGLWLDPFALLKGDLGRLHEVLTLGLHSREHAQFVAELARKKA